MAIVSIGMKALAVGLTLLRLFVVDGEEAGEAIEWVMLLLELIDLWVETVRRSRQSSGPERRVGD